MSELKHIKEIMIEQFTEVKLSKHYHPRGMLYYPECDASRAILDIVGTKRGAFKKHELDKIRAIGKGLGLTETRIIFVVPNDEIE